MAGVNVYLSVCGERVQSTSTAADDLGRYDM